MGSEGWSGQSTHEVEAENLAPGGMQFTWKDLGHLRGEEGRERKGGRVRGDEKEGREGS